MGIQLDFKTFIMNITQIIPNRTETGSAFYRNLI